jgi:hypothetical protein
VKIREIPTDSPIAARLSPLAYRLTGALGFNAKAATEEKGDTTIRREAHGKGQGARNINPLALNLSPQVSAQGRHTACDSTPNRMQEK